MFNEEENRTRAFVRHREETATVTGKVHNFSFINQCIKWLMVCPQKGTKIFCSWHSTKEKWDDFSFYRLKSDYFQSYTLDLGSGDRSCKFPSTSCTCLIAQNIFDASYSENPFIYTEEQQLYNVDILTPSSRVSRDNLWKKLISACILDLFPVTTHTSLPWVNGGAYTLGSLFASIDQYTSTVLCWSIYSPPLINKTQRCLNSFTRGRSEQSVHHFPADNDVSVVPILIPVTSHSPANHPI